MHYEGMIIRPPLEAESLIVQVTVGCSHNKCTFCVVYKDKKFKIKDFSIIKQDIDEAAESGWMFQTAFLADGDVLIIPQEKLLKILNYLRERIPSIERVGVYGSARSILRKSPDQLKELRRAGLGVVYQGLESGDDSILEWVRKGVTVKQQIEAGRRVKEAGITISNTIIIGLGGEELSRKHALATAEALNQIDPDHVRIMTIQIHPGTPLYEMHVEGKFEIPDPFMLLEELYLLVSNLEVTEALFFCNHPSNYVSMVGRLPGDKQAILDHIRKVIDHGDRSLLRPEYLRMRI